MKIITKKDDFKKDHFFISGLEFNLLDQLVSLWPATTSKPESSPPKANLPEMLNLFIAHLFPEEAHTGKWVPINLHDSHLIYYRAEHLGYSSIHQAPEKTKKVRIKLSINHLGVKCCDPDLVVFNKNDGYYIYLEQDQQAKLQEVIDSIKETIKKYKSIEDLIENELKKLDSSSSSYSDKKKKLENLKYEFYKVCANPDKSVMANEFTDLIEREKFKEEEESNGKNFLAILGKEMARLLQEDGLKDKESKKIQEDLDKKEPEKEISIDDKRLLQDFKNKLRDIFVKPDPIMQLSKISNKKYDQLFKSSSEETKSNLKNILYEQLRTPPDVLLKKELEELKGKKIEPLLESVIEEYQSIKKCSSFEEKGSHPLVTAIREAKPVKEILELCQQNPLHAQDIRDNCQKTLIDMLLLNDYYHCFSFNRVEDPNALQKKEFNIEAQKNGSFKYWVRDNDGTLFKGTMTQQYFKQLFGHEHSLVLGYIENSNSINLKRYSNTFLKYFSSAHPKIEQNKCKYLKDILQVLVDAQVPINRSLNKENFLKLYENDPKFFKEIIGLLVQAGSISRPEFNEEEASNLGLIEQTCFFSVVKYLIKFHNENPAAPLGDLIDEFFSKENIDKTGYKRFPWKKGKQWLLTPSEIEKEIIKWELVFNKNGEGPSKDVMAEYYKIINRMIGCLDLKDHPKYPGAAGAKSPEFDHKEIPAEMIAIFMRVIFSIGRGGSDGATCVESQLKGTLESSPLLFTYIREQKDALQTLMGQGSIYEILKKNTGYLASGPNKQSIVIKSLLKNDRRSLAIYLGGCPALCQLITQKGETLIDIFIKNTEVKTENIADHLRTLKFLIEDYPLSANKILSDNELNSLFEEKESKDNNISRKSFFTTNIAL